jgi:hypothetical protein
MWPGRRRWANICIADANRQYYPEWAVYHLRYRCPCCRVGISGEPVHARRRRLNTIHENRDRLGLIELVTAIITISTAILKALIDAYRWPFESHWVGFTVSAAIVFVVCWISSEIFPIFMFNVIFNPALNLLRALPFFFIGNTAKTDQILKDWFGEYAGQAWFFCNLTLLILTI